MLFVNVTIKWRIYLLPLETLKKEQYFFSQIADQPTSQKTILLRFLPTDVYLDEI